MISQICKNWSGETRRLPGIDCIAYPDGRVTVLRCCVLYDPETKERARGYRPLCDTDIESLEKYRAACWTVIDEWASVSYEGGKIYGGDGGMGNEGFIACADARDELVWGMFFESTNPIRHLKIEGKTLVAINEHNELRIEINLDSLTEIKLIPIKS